METENNDTCRKRNGKETSFEFKIAVIAEIANGQISANFASKKYNISRSTIAYWQKKLSNYTVEKKFKSSEVFLFTLLFLCIKQSKNIAKWKIQTIACIANGMNYKRN